MQNSQKERLKIAEAAKKGKEMIENPIFAGGEGKTNQIKVVDGAD